MDGSAERIFIMKKSGILMFVGPTLMMIGMNFSSQIALWLFGTESIHKGFDYTDYALTNRTNAVLVCGGLFIFILSIIILFRERKRSIIYPGTERLNMVLSVLGAIIFFVVAFLYGIFLLLALTWK